jgi:hypothetical protein
MKNVPITKTLAYLAAASGAKKKVLKEFYETLFLVTHAWEKIS